MPEFKVIIESKKTTEVTVKASNMRFAIDSAMEKIRKGRKSNAIALAHTVILDVKDKEVFFSRVVAEPITKEEQ